MPTDEAILRGEGRSERERERERREAMVGVGCNIIRAIKLFLLERS